MNDRTTRRAAVGLMGAGGALVVTETLGVTQLSAPRRTDVAVADDPDALLGIENLDDDSSDELRFVRNGDDSIDVAVESSDFDVDPERFTLDDDNEAETVTLDGNDSGEIDATGEIPNADAPAKTIELTRTVSVLTADVYAGTDTESEARGISDSDGAEDVWRVDLAYAVTDVAVDPERLYVSDDGVNLRALDRTSGDRAWIFDDELPPINALAADSDDGLYLGNDDDSVWRIDASDGTTEWADDSLSDSPITGLSVGGSKTYASTEGGELYRFEDGDDGIETSASVSQLDDGTALVRTDAVAADENDEVYVGDHDGNVARFDGDLEQVWSATVGTIVTGITVDGAVADGSANVYAVDDAGELHEFDAVDGTVETAEIAETTALLSVTATDDAVYVGGDGDELHKVDDDLATEWTFSVAGRPEAVAANREYAAPFF